MTMKPIENYISLEVRYSTLSNAFLAWKDAGTPPKAFPLADSAPSYIYAHNALIAYAGALCRRFTSRYDGHYESAHAEMMQVAEELAMPHVCVCNLFKKYYSEMLPKQRYYHYGKPRCQATTRRHIQCAYAAYESWTETPEHGMRVCRQHISQAKSYQ